MLLQLKVLNIYDSKHNAYFKFTNKIPCLSKSLTITSNSNIISNFPLCTICYYVIIQQHWSWILFGNFYSQCLNKYICNVIMVTSFHCQIEGR